MNGALPAWVGPVITWHTIYLNEADWAMAEKVADLRRTKSREDGAVERIADSTLSVEHRERMGAAAELAVAKALNIYPLLSWNYGSYDLRFPYPDRATVDVKYTERSEGDLYVRPLNRGKKACDIYVLVVPAHTPEAVNIVGWVDGTRAFQGRRVDFGNRGKPVFVTPQSELRPFQELLNRRRDWYDS